MKSMRNLTLRQYLSLIGGACLFCFGMYQLLRYTFGYPITFGIPGTAFFGSGSKVASAYGIICVLGGMLFRRVYDKLPPSNTEA